AFVVAGLLLLGLRLSRSGTVPNLRLAGRSVGGLDAASLRKVVERVAAEQGKETVTAIRPGSAEFPKATASATRQDLGFRVDVEATVRELLSRGRQGNPFAALADHLVASFLTIHVRPVERIDQAAFARWVAKTAGAL